MTTVYPGGGNSQNIDNSQIFGVDLVNGEALASDGYPETPSGVTTKYVNNGVIKRTSQQIKLADQALGENLATKPDVHAVVGNRDGSVPSGYTAGGKPTFGDGQEAVNTTYPADQEITTGGELTYHAPLATVNKDYSSLTS